MVVYINQQLKANTCKYINTNKEGAELEWVVYDRGYSLYRHRNNYAINN